MKFILGKLKTKKAGTHTWDTLSLLEAASYKMVASSFMNDCSNMSRILRGNTKALYKLLLHAST